VSYFAVTPDCQHHKPGWENVVVQIYHWPPDWQARFTSPVHHIEAKALQLFTIARRYVRSADQLAQANGNRWQLIFVEATSLLFPVIELIGEARRDKRVASSALGAGIQWLRDPGYLPPAQTNNDVKVDTRRLDTLLPFMTRAHGPQVSDLFFIRNYFLHGLKSHRDPTVSIADLMNYELPRAIARYSEIAMRDYWQQLKQDDGTHDWVSRLAQADIHPFPIQGSNHFEAGLIDPDIIEYLENPSLSVISS
jgi:hypothetical protein